MRYVAAALLAALGEKSIDAKNIKSILGSVGIEAEADKIDLVVKELAGKNLEELIAEGQTKLASMPAGGGAAAPAAGGAAAPAAEAAKVEEKEEEKEESDDDMGFGLFD
jgi:large subunit ribosomal protein LP2